MIPCVALQAKPRRSAAGWAAAVGAVAAGSRSEVRLLRQSWQSSQGYIQQGLRRITSSPHASSVQTLAAAGWPCHVSFIRQMLQFWLPLVDHIALSQVFENSWCQHWGILVQQGISSLWRFGRHSLSSTSDGNDGVPAASASVDSSVDIPLTKTLPVLTPLPEEG